MQIEDVSSNFLMMLEEFKFINIKNRRIIHLHLKIAMLLCNFL